MQKFIRVTYGRSWFANLNPQHIALVENTGDGGSIITIGGTSYQVDQTVEEIMEMIRDADIH